MIFETLNKLNKKESKVCSESEQPLPSYTYLDDNNQIKQIPLSKDSAGAMIIEDNKKKKKSPAKLIRDSIFAK